MAPAAGYKHSARCAAFSTAHLNCCTPPVAPLISEGEKDRRRRVIKQTSSRATDPPLVPSELAHDREAILFFAKPQRKLQTITLLVIGNEFVHRGLCSGRKKAVIID
jgi:hypothetical protein